MNTGMPSNQRCRYSEWRSICFYSFSFPVVLLMICTSIVHAHIIHVPADSLTIQAGIDGAGGGDTVLVADGIYTGDGNRDIEFDGKNIIVISENGPDVTIIDCEGSSQDYHRGFYFQSGEDSTSMIRGFTITNGWHNQGGGICCYYSSPAIDGNTISGNTVESDGGGIYCYESSPVIRCNTITANSAYYGAGIFCQAGSAAIRNNVITWNTAEYYGGVRCVGDSSAIVEGNAVMWNTAKTGGGISCYNSFSIISGNTIAGNIASRYNGGGIHCRQSPSVIISNTIVGNMAREGGGIHCYEASPTILYNTIVANSVDTKGGGIECYRYCYPLIENNTITGNSAGNGGGMYSVSSSPTVKNCIFWGDSPWEFTLSGGDPRITYCDVQGGWEGEGNIDQDPLFVDPGDNNYSLLPESPCVDAGSPESPPDPDSTRADMGAFFHDQRALVLSVFPDLTCYHRGDTLGFTVSVMNNEDSTIVLQGWTEGDTPSGVIVTPLLGPINGIIGAYSTVISYITQYIPVDVNYGGPYTYRVRVGNYPDEVLAEDYFTFYIFPALSVHKRAVHVEQGP